MRKRTKQSNKPKKVIRKKPNPRLRIETPVSFTDGLITFENGAYSASLLPRKGSRVVRLEGAIHAGPWHAPFASEPVADIVASLLDEGTQKRSRELFRFSLEEYGAQVRFWAEDRYVFFSVVSKSSLLREVLTLAFEALREPLLSEVSSKEVIEREAATRLHDQEDTRVQAGRGLARLLYAPESSGYAVSPEEERMQILGIDHANILDFFKEHYRGRIVIAAVGDIQAQQLERVLDDATEGWNGVPGESSRPVSALASTEVPRELFIAVPGKESVDVCMGSVLRVLTADPVFPALRLGIDILGGGFSDHLMQTIRDRDGLTYGTHARIHGRANQNGMHWFAWAMFGNSLYEKGMEALWKEISTFVKKGITEKRLAEKIIELEGRTAVLFSDPRAAVAQLRTGMLSVGSARDADTYLEAAKELSAKDVERALQKHLRIDAIAAAGAIDAEGKLL